MAVHTLDSVSHSIVAAPILSFEGLRRFCDAHRSGEIDLFRGNQLDVFRDLHNYLERGGRAGYMLLPCRYGKTLLYLKLADILKVPTLLVVPTQLGGGQVIDEINTHAPGLDYQLTFEGQPSGAPLTITTYANLVQKYKSGQLSEIARPLIILDEVHEALGPKRSKAIEELKKTGIIVGGTATDRYYSNKYVGQLLPDLIHKVTFAEAVALGMTAPVSVFMVKTDADLVAVKTVGGEFDRRTLARAVEKAGYIKAAIEIFQHHEPGSLGVIHCVNKHLAFEAVRLGSEAGLRAISLTSDDNKDERTRKLALLNSGQVDLVSGIRLVGSSLNCAKINISFNCSPSMSALAVEQRGSRPGTTDPSWPDKHAYVYEFLPARVRGSAIPVTFVDVLNGETRVGPAPANPPQYARERSGAPKVAIGPVLYETTEITAAIEQLRDRAQPDRVRLPGMHSTEILTQIQNVRQQIFSSMIEHPILFEILLERHDAGLSHLSAQTLEQIEFARKTVLAENKQWPTDLPDLPELHQALRERVPNADLYTPGLYYALKQRDENAEIAALEPKVEELDRLVRQLAHRCAPLVEHAVKMRGGDHEENYQHLTAVTIQALYSAGPQIKAVRRFLERHFEHDLMRPDYGPPENKRSQRPLSKSRLPPAASALDEAMTAEKFSLIRSAFERTHETLAEVSRKAFAAYYLDPSANMDEISLAPSALAGIARSRLVEFGRAIGEDYLDTDPTVKATPENLIRYLRLGESRRALKLVESDAQLHLLYERGMRSLLPHAQYFLNLQLAQPSGVEHRDSSRLRFYLNSLACAVDYERLKGKLPLTIETFIQQQSYPWGEAQLRNCLLKFDFFSVLRALRTGGAFYGILHPHSVDFSTSTEVFKSAVMQMPESLQHATFDLFSKTADSPLLIDRLVRLAGEKSNYAAAALLTFLCTAVVFVKSQKSAGLPSDYSDLSVTAKELGLPISLGAYRVIRGELSNIHTFNPSHLPGSFWSIRDTRPSEWLKPLANLRQACADPLIGPSIKLLIWGYPPKLQAAANYQFRDDYRRSYEFEKTTEHIRELFTRLHTDLRTGGQFNTTPRKT